MLLNMPVRKDYVTVQDTATKISFDKLTYFPLLYELKFTLLYSAGILVNNKSRDNH